MWEENQTPPTDDFRGIQFTPADGFVGQISILFAVSDNGFAGLGSPCIARANYSLVMLIDRSCYPFCGSCCLPNGGPCALVAYDECRKRDGVFISSTECSNKDWGCSDEANNPHPIMGSCCINDERGQHCMELRDDRKGYNVRACRHAGGAWTPNGKCESFAKCPCASNTVAACCAPHSAQCVNLQNNAESRRLCLGNNGQFLPGQNCEVVDSKLVCPSPGSCCYNGSCYENYEMQDCRKIGGSWSYLECERNTQCASYLGACCYEASVCADIACFSVDRCVQVTTREKCDSVKGQFLIGGTCGRDICQKQCIPNCGNSRCGSDGCGGSCGACDKGQYCDFGKCAGCDCGNNECGQDQCGNDCGYCDQVGYVCNTTRCVYVGDHPPPPVIPGVATSSLPTTSQTTASQSPTSSTTSSATTNAPPTNSSSSTSLFQTTASTFGATTATTSTTTGGLQDCSSLDAFDCAANSRCRFIVVSSCCDKQTSYCAQVDENKCAENVTCAIETKTNEIYELWSSCKPPSDSFKPFSPNKDTCDSLSCEKQGLVCVYQRPSTCSSTTCCPSVPKCVPKQQQQGDQQQQQQQPCDTTPKQVSSATHLIPLTLLFSLVMGVVVVF